MVWRWVNKPVSFTVSLRRRERVVEMSEEDLTKLLVRVDIPDIKTQVCCSLLLYFHCPANSAMLSR